jgi:ABC-type transporter Mla subunit MlaD
VNDLNKLHKVIDALEEQSAQVDSFNGVLNEVKEAKASIDSSKGELEALVLEQKKLVKHSYKKTEEFGTRVAQLEAALSKVSQTQKDIFKTVSTLEFLSPEAFEQGITESRRELAEQVEQLSTKLGTVIEGQQADIKSLRNITIFGVVTLIAGISLVAAGAFL